MGIREIGTDNGLRITVNGKRILEYSNTPFSILNFSFFKPTPHILSPSPKSYAQNAQPMHHLL